MQYLRKLSKYLGFIVYYLRAVGKHYKDKKYQPIIIAFFNLNGPCPQEITNCKQLREEYITTINNYVKFNACAHCDVQYVHSFYIKKIKDSITHE